MSVTIDTDKCEGSGVCSMVCPEDIIDIRNSKAIVLNQAACTSCWKCAESCISSAINID